VSAAGTVGLEIAAGGVATISLDRPQRANAFSVAMRDALWEALLAVRDHPDVVACVIRAEGPHFSVGADLSEFGTAGSLFDARRIRFERPLWELMWTLPKPVVAALRGYTLGSGLEIALMCDARLAAPDVELALPEARFGMLPAAGGSQTLARVAGLSTAVAAILRCERFDAERALASGIVDAIHDDVETAARRLAECWAELGPVRAQSAKRAIRAAVDLAPADAQASERRLARTVAAVGAARG
jgi:enoyl-CoA hydratase/carnithine racemase